MLLVLQDTRMMEEETFVFPMLILVIQDIRTMVEVTTVF